jgi:hypothetical protein
MLLASTRSDRHPQAPLGKETSSFPEGLVYLLQAILLWCCSKCGPSNLVRHT